MAALSLRDLRNLNQSVAAVYALSELEKFPSGILEIVEDLIPCDASSYNEILTSDSRVERLVINGLEIGTLMFEAFERHMKEHPLIAHAQRNPGHRAMRISDMLSAKQFHRTGIYNEFFRLVGVRSQMAVGIVSRPGFVAGVTVNRAVADFSEREKLLLDLLSPHIHQAHRSAQMLAFAKAKQRQSWQLMEDAGTQIVTLKPGLGIESATTGAQRMLGEYYPQPGRRSDQLPLEVHQWLLRAIAVYQGGQKGAAPKAVMPLGQHQPGRSLMIRLVVRSDGGLMLVLKENSVERQLAALHALSLTKREAQVLAWMTQGKTDSEISILLGMGRRTIEKHLEHIFRKLDVANRVGAVVRAMEATG